MELDLNLKIGSLIDGNDINFLVWAPFAKKMNLITESKNTLTSYQMHKHQQGYFSYQLKKVKKNLNYYYQMGNKKLPDPASRFQPKGINGPSQVIANDFTWDDGSWSGLPLDHYIIYELHVGAFSKKGTFLEIIPLLKQLKDLGITAIELMPIAQFSGKRNWGYDGVFPFAIQNTYGKPNELKQLVNACHKEGLAIILDVVYNHLGPEGNILQSFGPYFTHKYQTPWGFAINFDDEYNHLVRRYFIENALHWFSEYHFDALRLDALHAIYDLSAYPFLLELSEHVHALANKINKKIYLIAESDLNDPKLLLPKTLGGYGLDAQWNDEFHHVIHTLLTNERSGYYQDYGQFRQLTKTFSEGYVYSGQYSMSRKRPFGRSSKKIKANQWVVFSQNHDQIGNRISGERNTKLINFSQLKLAAATVILSPFIPLLFMGEEYGEVADFRFFTDYSDLKLIKAMKEGRKNEFNYPEEIYDPQALSTFIKSKLNHSLKKNKENKILFQFYQNLLDLRKKNIALTTLNKKNYSISTKEKSKLLIVHRLVPEQEILTVFNFSHNDQMTELSNPEVSWSILLNSEDKNWSPLPLSSAQVDKGKEGDLIKIQPYSCLLLERK